METYTYQLEHDQDDRITRKTETVNGESVTWTYAYDMAGRLAEAYLDGRTICQCRYDNKGRRTLDYFPRTVGMQIRNYQYTADDRLMSAGNNRYTHDKNGMRILWNAEGRHTRYEYAPDNRLLKVAEEETGRAFDFRHDDNGQRGEKYLNGELVETYDWFDFTRLAGFSDVESGYRFIYEDTERTPYAMQRDDGPVFHLHYDQVGSLRVVADQSGQVIKEILYDPFGAIINETNLGLNIPIGFAGGLHDRDLGFVRFGWRDYDAFTGRWTTPDPMGQNFFTDTQITMGH